MTNIVVAIPIIMNLAQAKRPGVGNWSLCETGAHNLSVRSMPGMREGRHTNKNITGAKYLWRGDGRSRPMIEPYCRFKLFGE